MATDVDPRRIDVLGLELVGGVEKRNLTLVDYDGRWPVLFREHQECIRRALSGTAIAVEHIGSTSVPGLAAKPIMERARAHTAQSQHRVQGVRPNGPGTR